MAERRSDDELRVLLTAAAREGSMLALREFAANVLQINLEKPDEVRTWQADLRWAHQMRKLSERGKIIFLTVLFTAISAAAISYLWSGFTATVKAAKVIVPMLILLALMGCAAVLLGKQPIPAGLPLTLGALPCEAAIEWWDEDGDGRPDYMLHRPDGECLRKYLEKPKADRGAF